MKNKDINAVIDFGKSEIKLCVFDKKKNIISFVNKEIEFHNNEKKFNEVVKNIIRKSEKEISSHIDIITVLVDDSNFFTIDISIKKNIEQTQSPNDIHRLALKDCYQTIYQSNKEVKIVNHFSKKFFIDKKEVSILPENFINNSTVIFEFKFLCIPEKKLFWIRKIFKNNNINLKNILCSSFVRSNFYLNLFKDEKYLAFVDIGLLRSSLIFYKNKKLDFINNVLIGSDNITKDISYIMKLDIKESENIKKAFNKSETEFSFLDNNHTEERFHKKSIIKKKNIDIIKKIILARIDEIIKLLFNDLEFSLENLTKDELVVVLIGRGSKIFDKNTFNFESSKNFKDIIFYDENSRDICQAGLEFDLESKIDMSSSIKITKKVGIFEKFFNIFQKF